MAKQAVSRTKSSSSSRKPRVALFEPARAPMMSATPMPTHEAIAQRAFELYLARGQAGGDDTGSLPPRSNRPHRGDDDGEERGERQIHAMLGGDLGGNRHNARTRGQNSKEPRAKKAGPWPATERQQGREQQSSHNQQSRQDQVPILHRVAAVVKDQGVRPDT